MSGGPRQSFRLFDTVCLIVGIIVGAGIYETAPTIASSVPNGWWLIGLWILGGLFSLAGAMTYAELATTYPRDGGDVIYLSNAYGRWAGFLFGWLQLVIVRPGDIAALAFVFSRYAQAMGFGGSRSQLASLAVVIFSLVNLSGASQARWTQNGMTVVKLAGLAVLILIGFTSPGPTAEPSSMDSIGLPMNVAMVLVLFCYGGWNEMVYIAAEVRDARRNIFRSMVVGIAVVITLYVLANISFLKAIGHDGLSQSSAVAVDVVAQRWPAAAQTIVAAFIAFSALGALNGQILTGARVSYSTGAEYRLFRRLGSWNEKRQSPAAAILLQMVVSLAMINLLQDFADTLLYMASSVYTFYFFSGLSVIVLRFRDRDTPRFFRVPGYPVTVIMFLATCLFMIHATVTYRPLIAGISLAVLLAGIPLYWVSEKGHSKRHQRSDEAQD